MPALVGNQGDKSLILLVVSWMVVFPNSSDGGGTFLTLLQHHLTRILKRRRAAAKKYDRSLTNRVKLEKSKLWLDLTLSNSILLLIGNIAKNYGNGFWDSKYKII